LPGKHKKTIVFSHVVAPTNVSKCFKSLEFIVV